MDLITFDDCEECQNIPQEPCRIMYVILSYKHKLYTIEVNNSLSLEDNKNQVLPDNLSTRQWRYFQEPVNKGLQSRHGTKYGSSL